MNRDIEGIGDRYHRETKYRCKSSRVRLSIAQEYPVIHFPIHPRTEEKCKSLWDVISERRSRREFSSRPISLSDLSQLIRATQGITRTEWGHDFRACPSAGALYPIETYVVVNRVTGLRPGIYHYDVKATDLVLMREGEFGAELKHAALDQEMLEDAAAVFIWTAVVERSKRKYHERAYRYIYMDSGHIGQNLYLAATAMNLGCCTVGAFFDDEVDLIVGIDGKKEISVYLGVVGRTV